MDIKIRELASVLPVVSERQCGGWMARTPDDSGLRIGVTALTEGEVRALFDRAKGRWLAALEVRDLV